METTTQTIEKKAVIAMIEAHNSGYSEGSHWEYSEKYDNIIVRGHGVHKLATSVSLLFCGVAAWSSGENEVTIAIR